jgi:hypothetical protein
MTVAVSAAPPAAPVTRPAPGYRPSPGSPQKRCGRSSKTIWVADQADQVGRFGPLVAASDTSSAADLVLTGSATGKALAVTHVLVSSGAIASDQMWQALYGLLT